MEISYTTPLRQSWQRMQAMLFRPFHIEKWFVVGLAAFVANLLGTGGGMFGWNNGFFSRHDATPRVEHGLDYVRDHLVALLEKPMVLLVIAAAMVMVCVLLLACTWASARGRFVFLDNVVTGRGAFVEPWRRYGRLGQSLFLWWAAFSFAGLLPLGAAALPFAHAVAGVLRGDGFVMPPFASIALGLAIAGLLLLLLGLVAFLTEQFVVPLMMLYNEGVGLAWARFWPLFQAHMGDFIACALFAVVVYVGVSVALVVAGVATCCIGLLLMMIPYVNSVLLLPVYVTSRAFGPAFLAQYGPEWDLFAKHAADAGAPAGPLPG